MLPICIEKPLGKAFASRSDLDRSASHLEIRASPTALIERARSAILLTDIKGKSVSSKAVNLDASELFGLDQIARLIKRDRGEEFDFCSRSQLASKIGDEDPPVFQARILVKAGTEDPDLAP